MPDEPRATATDDGAATPPTAPIATTETNPPVADAVSAAGAGETSDEAASDVTPDDVTRAARARRGMLSDDLQYAVYLHPGALETLGETIAPFLTHGPHGPHLVCSDIDTAGALAEMTVETITAEGAHQRTEVMFPVAMIRLVVSIGGLVDGFGFRTRV
jgi:hypothetical protein